MRPPTRLAWDPLPSSRLLRRGKRRAADTYPLRCPNREEKVPELWLHEQLCVSEAAARRLSCLSPWSACLLNQSLAVGRAAFCPSPSS